MTSTLTPWLKGSVRFAEVFVTQLQRCLLVCWWRCGELVWIGNKWILMMIYGSGNRNCLHKGHGLFCSIVLAYSKFLIPLPQLFKCENYGFSMTTLIVIFFTFLKTPCGFWIQACSFRCAKVSVHSSWTIPGLRPIHHHQETWAWVWQLSFAATWPSIALAADTKRDLAVAPRIGKKPLFCLILPPKCQTSSLM